MLAAFTGKASASLLPKLVGAAFSTDETMTPPNSFKKIYTLSFRMKAVFKLKLISRVIHLPYIISELFTGY